MAEHVKQHYIPVCYLQNFCFEKNAIWVYDKQQSKTYCKNPNDVCYYENYYDIEDSVRPQSMDKKYVEVEFLANDIESEWNNLLCKLTDDIDELLKLGDVSQYTLNDENARVLIAKHIAIQYLRHPDLRQYFTLSMAQWHDLLSRVCNNKALTEQELDSIAQHIPSAAAHWSCGFGNADIIPPFVDRLLNNYWTLHVSPLGEFHTSDTPILIEPHLQNVNNECLGLALEGGEVTFPLTPKLLLKIWDNRYFSDKQSQDRTIVVADSSFIKLEQARQYLFANRLVFSNCKNFDVAHIIRELEGKEMFWHYTSRPEIIQGSKIEK